nr:myoferlin-like [Cherax quadricarinatus]
MSLEIKVVSASSLQNLETLGKSDPYVTINFQGEKKKTEVQDGTLDPVWEETLKWELGTKPPRADECIDITVKDYERIGKNRLLGKATIALRNVVHAAPGTPLDYDLGLLDANDSPTVGTLKLTISYTPPAGASTGGGRSIGALAARSAGVTSELADGMNHSAGGRGKKRGKFRFGPKRLAETVLKETDSRISATPDGGVDAATVGGMPQMPQQRNRDKLSSAKTKFQIRVRVVEGRQLMGCNINPVCQVSMNGNARQTKAHKGTTTPWFDQIFFFQVEKLPAEVMEDYLEFKVCNSSGIRASTLIGSFKCEVGMVYDQAEHAILNRWLVLANPEEPTPTVQGYLKVCVAVLGPGDVCPDMTARQSDQDDVEANLLWSAGVHLQPATFILTVYCAQNLPRMDAGTMQTLRRCWVRKTSKELVDPYLMAGYAGREVQTKILYTNENPEFRQNLHMGFLFPSMCNVIKITLKDWFFFQPLGPSLGEGYTERGPEWGSSKIRGYRGTRKFILKCQISGAWHLEDAGKPLEVEVSIGNFGNKLENTMMPSPSSTHPSNPVFDGCKYYFLPWSGAEPFVTVHCDYEDVTHRLHCVNHITAIIMTVKKNLHSLKSLLRGRRYKQEEDKEVEDCIQTALSNLVSACNMALPEVDPVRHTETSLDRHLRDRRRLELDQMKTTVLKVDTSDPQQVVVELESALDTLEVLAQEPQSSIPDVFLWMMSGTKRLAYVRIPAHSVLFAHEPTSQGTLAGKFHTYTLRKPGAFCFLPSQGTFRVYPLSPDDSEEPPLILDGFPSPSPQEVVARVYVVLGQDLAPKDAGGSSDPYIVVKLGKMMKTSKDNYRPNTLNPLFGEVFEVAGTLPLHKDLLVQVWDRDLITSDDLIGETTIDLENRYLTRHRATIGLPRQYHVSGGNKWRDIELPTEILKKAAHLRNLEGPVWQSQPLSLTLSGVQYSLTDFEPPDSVLPPTVGDSKERLALYVLHKAMPLVPEHVETRVLMHPAHPGLPQGQLKLWVDIYPFTKDPLPTAVDITPRQAHKYVLRIVVYNVFEAPLQETSFVGGEKMSDVYVKGWLQGTTNVQKTDIHYRYAWLKS